MSVTSNRKIIVKFTGDLTLSDANSAAENTDSPGVSEVKTLASGNNTITPPGGGTTPIGVTIIPPSDNEATLTLKGINGDTGIVLHSTDPTSLSLGSTTATFVIHASVQVTDVRLLWS